MKTARPPRKTSAARITAARPLPLLERPGFDMALRIGTAVMMTIAAALVLAHLTAYSLSLTHESFARALSSACRLGSC
jgi:hypothetical protein